MKNKITLKSHIFDPDRLNAEEYKKLIDEVLDESKQLEGCDGVYYELDFYDPYDERSHHHTWVFYRYETEEEFQVRKKKAEQAQLNYKRNTYERLKKELGL
jgi:hypothetical protein